MAVPRKLVVVPNSATRDLWRIAENGEIDELEAVLARAEINARNEHGMTALMRAARHGRVRMVRVLLEHGADANIARSDNFTALSLAAFFGHTEIVEMLLKHGARTDVATRYGTSPHMWATARSFGDVARCIEKGVDQTKSASTPIVSRPVSQVEVKTLKDPPEIWDLVHEAPRQFNARLAFITRIRSVKMGFLLRTAALLVVGVGIVAAWFWKDAWRNSHADIPPPVVSLPATPVETSSPVAAPTASAVVAPDTPVNTIDTPVNVIRRSRSLARSRSTQVNVPSGNTIETAPVAAAPPIAPKTEPRNESITTTKTTAPLSPQMISPPKTSQPKAKVIQWP